VDLQPTPSVTVSPSPTIIEAPPASGLETVGAILAIAFALAAAILGYRIIRGGRGL
jgi:hypothetical protein